jgi:hypothetical protein
MRQRGDELGLAGPLVTMRTTLIMRSVVPLLPWKRITLVPLAAFTATLTSTLAESLPPVGILRELGLKPETVTPKGTPVTVRPTVPAKPEMEAPVIVTVAELP